MEKLPRKCRQTTDRGCCKCSPDLINTFSVPARREERAQRGTATEETVAMKEAGYFYPAPAGNVALNPFSPSNKVVSRLTPVTVLCSNVH